MNNVLRLARKFFTRTPVAYALLAICFILLADQDKITAGIRARKLNDLIPASYAGLLELPRTGILLSSSKEMERFTRYYRTITKYHPGMADAHGMLGYCYYYRGDRHRAQISFERAFALNPHYFWFAYNLGLLSLKDNDIQRALPYFKAALKADPGKSMLFVRGSPMVLGDILRKSGIGADELVTQLQSGRARILFLIGTLQNNKYTPAMLNDLHVRMF